MPPGPEVLDQAVGQRDQHRRDEVAERPRRTAPSPLGELPSRARMRRASPLRFALALVASTAIGSMSTREHSPGAQPHRRDREDPGAAADIEHPRRGRLGGEDGAIGHGLQRRKAQPGRRVEPGPEGHARVEREDHVARLAVVAPPRRADHDPAADPQHREVRLPRVRPIGLLHDACVEVADRPQPEGLEVAEVALRSGHRGARRPRRRATGGGRARAPVGRGRRAPPAPRRRARTPARRSSRRARPGTGSRTRPRPPRGRRRSRARASCPARRPRRRGRGRRAGRWRTGPARRSPQAQLLADPGVR